MSFISGRKFEKLSRYVKNNNVKRFKKYLKKYKIDIVHDDEYCTMLCTACRYGSYLIVRFLLESGVDVKKVSVLEKSALYLACEYAQTHLTVNVYNDLILPLLHSWPESVDNVNITTDLSPRQLLQQMKNAQRSSSEEPYSDDSYVSLKRKTREDSSDEEKYVQSDYEERWRKKMKNEFFFDQQSSQQYYNYEQEIYLEEKSQNWDDWASQIEREYNEKKEKMKKGTNSAYVRNYSVADRKFRNKDARDKQSVHYAGTYTPRISKPLLPENKIETKADSINHYNIKCNDIFNDQNCEGTSNDKNISKISKNKLLSFTDIPWPANASLEPTKLQYFLCGTDNIDIKCLKKERIRWHPDRFRHRTMNRLVEMDENKILKHVNHLSQIINQLIDTFSK